MTSGTEVAGRVLNRQTDRIQEDSRFAEMPDGVGGGA